MAVAPEPILQMSELADKDSELPDEQNRCPHCDSVVEPGADRCLMCGELLDGGETAVATPLEAATPELIPIPEPQPEPEAVPEIFESVMQEREAPVTFWLTAVFAIIIQRPQDDDDDGEDGR